MEAPAPRHLPGTAHGCLPYATAQAPKRDHMLRARVADLLLDTDLYGAHSTGTDALWAGLPILVLASLCPMALGAMALRRTALGGMALGRTAKV